MNHIQIKTIEDLSLNAWPSHQIQIYDGWLLRFSYFYTHRTNCVEQIGSSSIPLDTKIAYCEDTYRKWGTPSIFKISPLLPAGFDKLLDGRGYVKEHITDVMTLQLSALTRNSGECSGSCQQLYPGLLDPGPVRAEGDYQYYAQTRRSFHVPRHPHGNHLCIHPGRTPNCGYRSWHSGQRLHRYIRNPCTSRLPPPPLCQRRLPHHSAERPPERGKKGLPAGGGRQSARHKPLPFSGLFLCLYLLVSNKTFVLIL